MLLILLSLGSSMRKGVDKMLLWSALRPLLLLGEMFSSNSTMLTMESPPCRDPGPAEDVRSPEKFFDR